MLSKNFISIARFMSAVMTAALLLSASLPSAYAEPRSRHGSPSPQSFDFPPVDDPEQQSFIDRLLRIVDDIRNGVEGVAESLMRLIQDICHYLNAAFRDIETQTESSRCHDPDCRSYGAR